jgi:hypothetical protein
LHLTFGLAVEKLWGFEDFSPNSGMLSATLNAGKSAQICPNLPKTAQICQNLPRDETLKFRQKSRFQCFSKIKTSVCRGGIRACFHRLDFQSKNFSYAIFIVKSDLCM